METKNIRHDLLEQLTEIGIQSDLLKESKGKQTLQSTLLKYISGGRSNSDNEGHHRETFLKTPIGSIY